VKCKRFILITFLSLIYKTLDSNKEKFGVVKTTSFPSGRRLPDDSTLKINFTVIFIYRAKYCKE